MSESTTKAIARTDKWRGFIGEIRAALWDAHYGKGLSAEYARSSDKSLDGLLAEHDQLRSENEKFRELLQEVLNSGVEFDDPRMSYTLMQVDNRTLAEIRAALEVK